MSNNLNDLPVYSARQCFGVNQPVNAWPDAGADVFINSFLVGTAHYQIGWSADKPEDVFFRKTSGAGWSEWGIIGVTAQPSKTA